jgi:cell division protein FtsX
MTLQVAVPFPGVRAVIAEARRRQHRRRLITIAIVACAVVVASIAFIAFGHRSAGQPKLVKFYFAPRATTAQIRRTLEAAKAEHGVRTVTLITKGAVWADLKRRSPAAVRGVTHNPFLDSIQVRVSRADFARVVADLNRAQPTGIAVFQEGKHLVVVKDGKRQVMH